jgi:Na+/H+ antiporter NhaC
MIAVRLRTRATVALGLLAGLVWCLLLFGIGLDDLADDRTKAGVVISVGLLVVLIPALVFGIWWVVRPVVFRRFARR